MRERSPAGPITVHAIGQYVTQNYGPHQVRYVTTETFLSEYVDASRTNWNGPPYSAPPRGFVADLAPSSQYLIVYYEESNEAMGFVPVLTWGPRGSNTLFAIAGPAAGLMNGLVAKWGENARASCVG